MTERTKSTVKLLCARAGIARKEIPEEAQKLLDLFNDPDVSPEQKVIVKAELDKAIKKLEEKVTTRQMRKGPPNGGPSPAPAV